MILSQRNNWGLKPAILVNLNNLVETTPLCECRPDFPGSLKKNIRNMW